MKLERETAGFEQGGDQHKVGCGKSYVRQSFLKVADRYAAVQVMLIDDVMEYLLIGSIGDKYNLKVLVPVFIDNLKEDV